MNLNKKNINRQLEFIECEEEEKHVTIVGSEKVSNYTAYYTNCTLEHLHIPTTLSLYVISCLIEKTSLLNTV